MKKISVMVPCYNEEKGIGAVIDQIPRDKLKALGYEVDVLVVNNNSSDSTVEVARTKGVRVIDEFRQGKGCAIAAGFRNISDDTDIVVMLDGDNSYLSREMLRMIEPLDSDFCDVIIGTRLGGKMSDESMAFFNRAGNWLFTFLVRVGYSGNVTDVCTGYFAWKKHVVDELVNHIESNGFSVEMDMVTKMARLKYQIYSVPISYENRAGSSSLRPVKDGSTILYTWLKNLFWKPKPVLSYPDIRKQLVDQNE
jgi:glycosyltransferase involved in cell wall biosynthesis